MQLSQSVSMRMDQRQLLTPRMIQSMEILQLPLMALEERIEQELQNNPVLELREGDDEAEAAPTIADQRRRRADARADVRGRAAAGRRRRTPTRPRTSTGSTGSASTSKTKSSPPTGQQLPPVRQLRRRARQEAGRDEQHRRPRRQPAGAPAGPVGVRRMPRRTSARPARRSSTTSTPRATSAPTSRRSSSESKDPLTTRRPPATRCSWSRRSSRPASARATCASACCIQLDALEEDEELAEGHDFDLERALVRDHLKDLEMNRYPQISKRLGRTSTRSRRPSSALGRLHPHPGKQIGGDDAPPITPDAIIYYDEDTDKYEIEMANDPAPNLYISGMYRKMLKDRTRRQEDPRVPGQQRPQRPLADREHRAAQEHDPPRHPRGRRRPAGVLRQGPRVPQAAADDQRGRPARHPRRDRQPGRQRKVDPNPPRRLPAPPVLLRRHHQRRRRGHELGRGEGKAQDRSSTTRTRRTR